MNKSNQAMVGCFIFAFMMAGVACGTTGYEDIAYKKNEDLLNRPDEIERSIIAAGQCLLHWADPNDDYFPVGGWRFTHDTGRWWDAVLRIEAATNFSIPAEQEAGMLKNFYNFTNNPDGFLFYPPGFKKQKPEFELHSLREGLLAYTALIKYRNSNWAKVKAHQMLLTLERVLTEDAGIRTDKLGYYEFAGLEKPGSEPQKQAIAPAQQDRQATELKKQKQDADPKIEKTKQPFVDNTATTGRFAEALVLYTMETGDNLGLQLSEKLMPALFSQMFTADKRLRPEYTDGSHVGHTHSLMGTLKALALYASMTRNKEIMDTIANVYRYDLPNGIILESGWAGHDLGGTTWKNARGEPLGDLASTADYAELGFILAVRGGDTSFLDDTARAIRRLLASQCKAEDAKFLDPAMRTKMIGGWGIHGWPHGSKGAILDVVAEVAHCLTDIYKGMVEETDAFLKIALCFNYDSDKIKINVQDDDTFRIITLTPKVKKSLYVHIPSWIDQNTLTVKADQEDIKVSSNNHFIFIPYYNNNPKSTITIRYGLPLKTTTENIRNGRQFKIDWMGDRIIGICPNETPDNLPFYPTRQNCAEKN